MNPKLNVWRLETEKRYTEVDGERRATKVLVLRDEHGKPMRIAESFFEKEDLKKQYRRYNAKLKIEELPASKKLREKLASALSDLRKRGFTHRFISYGTTRNRRTGEFQYKRVEVFKGTPWSRREWFRMTDFFKEHVPKDSLGLFVFESGKLYKYPLDSNGKSKEALKL